MNQSNHKPRYFLLAGSASRSAAPALLDRAHAFVREITKKVLEAGDGFVVYTAAEPVNESNQPLIFDWTILREIDVCHPGESALPRVVIVLAERHRRDSMNAEQRALIAKLSHRGLARVDVIPDEVVTGGNVGDAQAAHAVGMIALGGGKGVSDRAYKMMKLGLPIYPMDLKIGANSEDGEGALGLHRRFMSTPLSFLSHTGARAVSKTPALSLDEPVLQVAEIAAGVVAILEGELVAEAYAAPTDVLVLTALPIELSAAKIAFGVDEETPAAKTDIGQNHWRAQLQTTKGNLATCTIATFGSAGNVDAAATTATLLMEFRPKLVIMIGIAAGLRKKTALGDVVISDRVVAYEGAALVAGGLTEARPETYRPAFGIQQDVSNYLASARSVTERLTQAWKKQGLQYPETSKAGDVATEVMPKAATIASGEKLFRDPEKFRQLRELHGKVEVAEMEAVGIFAACTQHGVPSLVIRGISDFGDTKKDNSFHELASRAAAIVAADMVAFGLGS
ncbi:5'-methylthioadenosine/S-adenosylhomocysteine nucleosidase [Burkholderia cenocepacia]|uniref:5'-methylthioadenosine/S-adenosylhomocysteine nucleosidase family protein n=1 Tax=Burkholderia cenocepacia TaxID=95486 RepID=UPI00265708A9|nr:5'-methylthioadenosine/S-adenosylhomocysteine nucleosidase [Burkholderia cenocepacia]MDN7695053.1 5'-methylthioadenosine/S-adenosylhomocysteine nucleosidase [Burkholderia cenocepacia]